MMRVKEVTVYDKDLIGTNAKVLMCPTCERDQFYIYFIQDHTQPHLQCTVCSTCYCGNSPNCGHEE